MGHVVNSRQWIEARIAHLRELLAGDPTDEERAAIEAELDHWRHDARQRGGLRRWLWPRFPHQHDQ